MRAALLLVALLLAGCAGPAPVPRACPGEPVAPGPGIPDAEDVAFSTPDGVMLQGSLWTQNLSHAVLLVTGVNEDRHSYDALAAALVGRGFTVLSFDLRGHGQSTTRGNDTHYEVRNFTADDFARMDMDAAAAVEVLRGRGAGPCIIVVGASVGANLALRVAVAKPGVVSAPALLSPGMDYHGLTTNDTAPLYRHAAVFLAAGRGDAYAAQSVHDLAPLFRDVAVTSVVLETSAHGTNLLREAGFQGRLVDWLVAAG